MTALRKGDAIGLLDAAVDVKITAAASRKLYFFSSHEQLKSCKIKKTMNKNPNCKFTPYEPHADTVPRAWVMKAYMGGDPGGVAASTTWSSTGTGRSCRGSTGNGILWLSNGD